MTATIKIFHPSGILNAISGNQLRRDIADIVTKETNIILIDLQNIDFIDSSGLGALVSTMQIVKSSGGQLFICSVNEQVKMLFELTKMERIFKIFQNQDEFNSKFVAI